MSPAKKQLIEFGPLLVFFAAYWKAGFIWATGALVVATLISITIVYLVERKLAKIQLFMASLVVLFGGLTVYFNDPVFLKAKVSILDFFLAAALYLGLRFDRLFIKDLLGASVTMPDAAWRTLTLRWIAFFAGLALLNLAVWILFSEAVWLSFKVFGLMGLTLVFAAANAPFMMKHMTDTDQNPSANG